MSKHAVGAFTDSLGLEMQSLRVNVSVIEPGAFHSEIGEMPARVWGRICNCQISRNTRTLTTFRRYRACLVRAAAKTSIPRGPERGGSSENHQKADRTVGQLNEGHPYTFDRNARVGMLDEALAGSRPRTAYRLDADRENLTGENAARIQSDRTSGPDPPGAGQFTPGCIQRS